MEVQERKDIIYDLEGPISSQDNAQAVCKKYVKDGQKLFPVISRFDDLLTLANKEGYEPGDTLGLIIPFLIEAGLTENEISNVSAEAGLVQGIPEFFAELQEKGCRVWIISTGYGQHADSIAKRVGVPLRRVHCTGFPLDKLRTEIGGEDLALVRETRETAVELYHEDLESGVSDEEMLELLNPFYWQELPKTKIGQATANIKVMGGRRKVWALERTLQDGLFLPHLCGAFIVVDSITDFRMAQVVEAAGGIALAWNANWYCLPWCSCGIAAVDARGVRPLFQAWCQGGRAAVREFVESAPLPEDFKKGPYYHWLAGRNEEFQREVLEVHKYLRTICRGAETAKLS